jgi:hypothetical protein
VALILPMQLAVGGHWNDGKWVPGNAPKYSRDGNLLSEVWESVHSIFVVKTENDFLPPLWIFILVYCALLCVCLAFCYQRVLEDARHRYDSARALRLSLTKKNEAEKLRLRDDRGITQRPRHTPPQRPAFKMDCNQHVDDRKQLSTDDRKQLSTSKLK